jgi:hypothetical protein
MHPQIFVLFSRWVHELGENQTDDASKFDALKVILALYLLRLMRRLAHKSAKLDKLTRHWKFYHEFPGRIYLFTQ